jgi:hypothetical protein
MSILAAFLLVMATPLQDSSVGTDGTGGPVKGAPSDGGGIPTDPPHNPN